MVNNFLNLFKRNDSNIHFIVGTGRSGTTILAKVLNAHTNICIPPELQILFEYSNNGKKLYDIFKSGEMKEWKSDDFITKIEKISPCDIKAFFDFKTFFNNYSYPIKNISKLICDLYIAIAKSYNKTIFLEQTPWYGQRLEVVKELFPDAKIIHMIRDGRDVSLSFARTPWWHNDPLKNLDRWVSESQKISDDLKKYFNKKNFIEVKYEDFIMDSENFLKVICNLLNITFEQNMLNPNNLISYEDYSKNLNKTKDIYSKEFNQWKNNQSSVFFSGNIYSWKKNPKIFDNISENNINALIKYGYEV